VTQLPGVVSLFLAETDKVHVVPTEFTRLLQNKRSKYVKLEDANVEEYFESAKDAKCSGLATTIHEIKSLNAKVDRPDKSDNRCQQPHQATD
jgi:hypothetical protein